MIVFKRLTCALLVSGGLCGATGTAFAEIWTVVEGEKGATRGIWQVTVDGPSITGSATMRGPRGQSLSYRLAGQITEGRYVLQRLDPTDQTVCTYLAEAGRSDKFAGTAICSGKSYPWNVTRPKAR